MASKAVDGLTAPLDAGLLLCAIELSSILKPLESPGPAVLFMFYDYIAERSSSALDLLPSLFDSCLVFMVASLDGASADGVP